MLDTKVANSTSGVPNLDPISIEAFDPEASSNQVKETSPIISHRNLSTMLSPNTGYNRSGDSPGDRKNLLTTGMSTSPAIGTTSIAGLDCPFTMIDDSAILDSDMLQSLWGYLPPKLRFFRRAVELVYNPSRDGISLQSLVRKFENGMFVESLVLIRDSDGFLFGGFGSDPWTIANSYYGQADSFVFTFGTRKNTSNSSLKVSYFEDEEMTEGQTSEDGGEESCSSSSMGESNFA